MRESIIAANKESGADRVTLPAGIYSLTIAASKSNLNSMLHLHLPSVAR